MMGMELPANLQKKADFQGKELTYSYPGDKYVKSKYKNKYP
jgi:hypothetical protein